MWANFVHDQALKDCQSLLVAPVRPAEAYDSQYGTYNFFIQLDGKPIVPTCKCGRQLSEASDSKNAHRISSSRGPVTLLDGRSDRAVYQSQYALLSYGVNVPQFQRRPAGACPTGTGLGTVTPSQVSTESACAIQWCDVQRGLYL